MTHEWRGTWPYQPGRLRQPSSRNSSSPLILTIFGLKSTYCSAGATSTSLPSSRSSTSGGISMIQSWIGRPICGAARPTPFAACIVSNISATSCLRVRSGSFTGRQWAFRIFLSSSLSMRRMRRIAMLPARVSSLRRKGLYSLVRLQYSMPLLPIKLVSYLGGGNDNPFQTP